MRPLRSSYFKVIRAEEHLSAFKAEIATFEQSEPYLAVPERSNDPPGYALRLHRVHTLPVRSMLTAGDCLHNLRAALDHLAWELVIEAGNTPRTARPATQFPILTKRREKNGEVLPAVIHPGVSKAAEALVERLQPYNAGGDPTQHPLAVLNQLENIDKHRRITFAIAFGSMGSAYLKMKDGSAMLGGQVDVGPFDDGDIVGWFPFAASSVPDVADIDFHAHFSTLVAIPDAQLKGTTTATDALTKLCAFVREEVVDAFARACF